jgi:hypothetical protein
MRRRLLLPTSLARSLRRTALEQQSSPDAIVAIAVDRGRKAPYLLPSGLPEGPKEAVEVTLPEHLELELLTDDADEQIPEWLATHTRRESALKIRRARDRRMPREVLEYLVVGSALAAAASALTALVLAVLGH